MSEDISIDILIKAQVEGADEVRELANSLEKIQGITGEVAKSMEDFGKKAIKPVKGMEEQIKKFDDVRKRTLSTMEQLDLLEAKQEEQEEQLSATAQAYANVFKKGEDYAKTLEALDNKISEYNKAEAFKNRLMEAGVTGALKQIDVVEHLHEITGRSTGSLERQINALQGLRGPILSSEQGLQKIIKAFEDYRGTSPETVWKEVGDSINITGRQIGWTSNQMMDLRRASIQGTDAAIEQARVNYEVRESIKSIYEMNRRYMASLGATGVAMQEFSRSIFWAGLGAMFTSMSIARSIRSYEQLQRQAFTLAQSHLRIADAQKEYNETLIDFGPASEEASMAHRRLVESQYAYDQALRSARYSTFQFYLSLGMLVFGMFPTFMRFGEAITKLTMQMAAADTYKTSTQMASNISQMGGVSSSSILGAAYGGLTGMVHALSAALMNATFWQNMLVGAATMGVGIIASLGISFAATEYSMSKMTREMEEMEDRLTGGNLVSDLEQGVLATEHLRKEMSRTTGDMPRQLSTEITAGVREPVILGRRDRGITVNIINPTIREDKDIKDIERAVKRGITKGAYSRIGRY